MGRRSKEGKRKNGSSFDLMRLYFQCKRLCAHWGEMHKNIHDYYYNYYSNIIIIILEHLKDMPSPIQLPLITDPLSGRGGWGRGSEK